MANSIVYDAYKGAALGKSGGPAPVDLDSDTLYVLLVGSGYTGLSDAAKQGHTYLSDLNTAGGEVSGAGYTAGGQPLAGMTLTKSGDTWTFTATNVAWTAATISATGCVVYKHTATATTSTLIAYLDFGATISSTAGTFTVQWNASGILTLT